jgi:hypothetical protein
MTDGAAAAAAAFKAGMHLQELGQGAAMARAKNRRSRDGSAEFEQQDGSEGMGEDVAASKSPKLWHSQTARSVELQEQQQPFLLWWLEWLCASSSREGLHSGKTVPGTGEAAR